MGYCCEDFQWGYTTSNIMGLNIRVVKLKNDYKNRAFFITEGFYEKIDEC